MQRLSRRQLVLSAGSAALLAGCGRLPWQTQPSAKVARIGFQGASFSSAITARLEAFRQGLRELGHVEGENIIIEYRFAEGQLDRLPVLAAELVQLKLDVIVTAAPSSTRAVKEATSTVPVVMAYDTDPVRS
jgi:putative ABC transport system substrate-binding protein